MFKSIFIISALILAVIFPLSPLAARQITPNEAYAAAQQLIAYENQHPGQRLSKGTYACARIEPLQYQGQPSGYVVHLQPGGFMILSGWSEDAPQKFICFNGDFPAAQSVPLIKAICTRMSATAIGLQHAPLPQLTRATGVTPPFDHLMMQHNQAAWEALLGIARTPNAAATVSEVHPLVTARWYQASPYNMYTPVYNGQPTYTGCTATAMAQVMYYWKYPARGRGTHTYRWYLPNINLSADFDHPYRWSDMLDVYDDSATATQKDAVARLMSDVGIAINMQYSPDGSGAYPNANNAFFRFFKYDGAVHTVNRGDYPDWTAWFQVFKTQLDLGRPMCMSVDSEQHDFPHEVVADGYRTTPSNQVHVNLGWGGMDDNYYDLNYIHVTEHHDKLLLSEDATIDIFPVQTFSILISGQKKRERTWLFTRDYAVIDLNFINAGDVVVSRFDVFRRDEASANALVGSIPGAAVSGDQCSYTDTFLAKGRPYLYQVRVVDNAGAVVAASNEFWLD
jgi:hypothetical protein